MGVARNIPRSLNSITDAVDGTGNADMATLRARQQMWVGSPPIVAPDAAPTLTDAPTDVPPAPGTIELVDGVGFLPPDTQITYYIAYFDQSTYSASDLGGSLVITTSSSGSDGVRLTGFPSTIPAGYGSLRAWLVRYDGSNNYLVDDVTGLSEYVDVGNSFDFYSGRYASEFMDMAFAYSTDDQSSYTGPETTVSIFPGATTTVTGLPTPPEGQTLHLVIVSSNYASSMDVAGPITEGMTVSDTYSDGAAWSPVISTPLNITPSGGDVPLRSQVPTLIGGGLPIGGFGSVPTNGLAVVGDSGFGTASPISRASVVPASDGPNAFSVCLANGNRSFTIGTYPGFTTYAGFWAGSGTPANSNYCFLSDGNLETIFNAPNASGSIAFRIAQNHSPNAASVNATGLGIKLNPSDISCALDVSSDKLRLRTAKTPASASAAGNAGDHCWDSGFLYLCVNTNTWKRVAVSTW